VEPLRVLCIGDIVGRYGRKMLVKHLPLLQKELSIDATVVNIENSASGFGITDKIYQQFAPLNIQVMTSGNHIFDKKDTLKEIDTFKRVIRPLNFHRDTPGVGFKIVDVKGVKVAVINAIGRLFMPHLVDSPFDIIDAALEKIHHITPIVIVDFHAETTAEKYVLGHHLSGRASVVFGTHTHVQTADERILNDHTAYITDLGMTGAHDSILGMQTDLSMAKMITQLPVSLEPPQKSVEQILCGIVVTLDPESGQALSIERIQRFDTL
jgi:2',3'-cyclic-nucleotide 2'-phosphodiesterase